jgi:hypothetical protein
VNYVFLHASELCTSMHAFMCSRSQNSKTFGRQRELRGERLARDKDMGPKVISEEKTIYVIKLRARREIHFLIKMSTWTSQREIEASRYICISV